MNEYLMNTTRDRLSWCSLFVVDNAKNRVNLCLTHRIGQSIIMMGLNKAAAPHMKSEFGMRFAALISFLAIESRKHAWAPFLMLLRRKERNKP